MTRRSSGALTLIVVASLCRATSPYHKSRSIRTRSSESSSRLRRAEAMIFIQVIFAQDRVIVESQRPEELPVDLSEELHLKGPDGGTLQYRRMLRELP